MKKVALQSAKTTCGLALGVGLSASFVLTMDDMIYQNFRKNVFLPILMMQMSGNSQGTSSTLDKLRVGMQGTGKFFYDMRPQGLDTTASARELLLKDADYSTPQDHYFAHLSRLKSGDDAKRQQNEENVLNAIGTDSSMVNYVIKQNEKQKTKTMLDEFDGLPDEAKSALAIKHGFDPKTDMHRLRTIFADVDGTWIDKGKAKIKKDKEILDNLDLQSLLHVRPDARKKVQYGDEFKEENNNGVEGMVKLKAKPVVTREEGKKLTRKERLERRRAREQELTDVLKKAENSEGVIDSDQAVQAIEKSQFEAAELTKRDIKRLQRLKRKAEEGTSPQIVGEGDFQ